MGRNRRALVPVHVRSVVLSPGSIRVDGTVEPAVVADVRGAWASGRSKRIRLAFRARDLDSLLEAAATVNAPVEAPPAPLLTRGPGGPPLVGPVDAGSWTRTRMVAYVQQRMGEVWPGRSGLAEAWLRGQLAGWGRASGLHDQQRVTKRALQSMAEELDRLFELGVDR